MKKKFAFFLILLFCCGFCAAQQVVSSGGYAMKSEVSVNWILGGSLSDIPVFDQNALNTLRKEQLMESEISLKVYPTPATDFINIEITPADTGRLNLELYNNTGLRVIDKVVVYQPVMQVDISDIPLGIYFLKVIIPSNKMLFGVEKIIKQ